MIVKRIHNSNYTIIGNDVLTDERLDAWALGVICYLIGRPNSWEVRAEQLCDRFGCGRDKMYGTLKSLVEFGYIQRRKLGSGDVEYIVYDHAQPDPENAEQATTLFREIPTRENPDALLSKDSKKVSKKQNTDSCSVAVLDDWPEDYFEQFYEAYPPGRKGQKEKVREKLGRLRRDKKLTWGVLSAGVARYVASRPGQYASAPLVWLNGEKWDTDYTARPDPGAPRGGGPSLYDMAMGTDGDEENR